MLSTRFAPPAADDRPRIGALCDVARTAGQANDTDLALDLLLEAAERAWWLDAAHETTIEIESALGAITSVPDDARVVAILALTASDAGTGAVIERLAKVDVLAAHSPDTLRHLGLAAHAVGDPQRAAALLTRAEKTCRADGLLGLLSQVLCLRAATCTEFDRAATLAREAVEMTDGLAQWNWGAMARAHLALANAVQDHVEHAVKLAGESERLADWRGLPCVGAMAQLARGGAWLSAGKYVEAFDELSLLFNRGSTRIDRARTSALMMYVEAATHADHADAARGVVAELEPRAFITPSPLLHAQLRYASALVAFDEDAEQRYRDALADDLLRWPWVRARLELAYGTWLRRHRRVVECRTQLRSACATFEEIGAQASAVHARVELRAAGERYGASGVEVESVLSPQELEITRLAASGPSNREIGQRLLLSHRTVGAHLYRVFPKLGITSRRQLAAHPGLVANDSLVAA